MSDKPHSDKQRNALHLWFRQCATVCQDAGYTLSNYVHDMESQGMELPITEGAMKEIFRAAYSRTTGYESTEEASTTDYEPAYNALVLFFGQRGIQLPPFPDRFTQADERGKIDSLGMERLINDMRDADRTEELLAIGRSRVPEFLKANDNDPKLRNLLTQIYLDRLAELEVSADNEGEQ